MSWGAVAVAVVGGVASYANSRSAEGAAEDAHGRNLETVREQIKGDKELLEQERGYNLEDRKFFQDSVGAWGKFADPSLMPSTFGEGGVASTSPRVAPFQGQRPQQGGAPFSFQSRFPEYDFFKRPELPYGQG